jgi:hypothetical protein
MGGLQPTRMTLNVLLYLVAVVTGGVTGGGLGFNLFGVGGAIAGGIVGAGLGHAVGVVPEWLSTRLMFRHISRSSDEELWKIVHLGFWNFYQTLALLQLAARGQDVRTQLPRIVKMLESDDRLQRVYGWDALRLVFPAETAMVADYNPQGTAEDCRNKAAKLQEIA